MERDAVDEECDAMLRELGLLGPSEPSANEASSSKSSPKVCATPLHSSTQEQPSSSSFGSRDVANLRQGSRSPLTPPLSPGSTRDSGNDLPAVLDDSSSNLGSTSTAETATPEPVRKEMIMSKRKVELEDDHSSSSALGLETKPRKKSRWDEPPSALPANDELPEASPVTSAPLPCVSELESGRQEPQDGRLRTPFSLEPSSTTSESVVEQPVGHLPAIPSLADEQDEEEDMDLDPEEEEPVQSFAAPVDEVVYPTPFVPPYHPRMRDFLLINGIIVEPRVIVVYHLPAEFSEEQKYRLFSVFGSLVSINSAGPGLIVNFTTRQSAALAVQSLNGRLVGDSVLRSFISRCKKQWMLQSFDRNMAIYLDGVQLTTRKTICDQRGFQDDGAYDLPIRISAPSVVPVVSASSPPPVPVWTGSLRLDSSDFSNLIPLRALRVAGQDYPPHLLATPLFPSEVLEHKGSLPHATLLDHLKSSIISSRKAVLSFEIELADDPHGLKLEVLKKFSLGSRDLVLASPSTVTPAVKLYLHVLNPSATLPSYLDLNLGTRTSDRLVGFVVKDQPCAPRGPPPPLPTSPPPPPCSLAPLPPPSTSTTPSPTSASYQASHQLHQQPLIPLPRSSSSQPSRLPIFDPPQAVEPPSIFDPSAAHALQQLFAINPDAVRRFLQQSQQQQQQPQVQQQLDPRLASASQQDSPGRRDGPNPFAPPSRH